MPGWSRARLSRVPPYIVRAGTAILIVPFGHKKGERITRATLEND